MKRYDRIEADTVSRFKNIAVYKKRTRGQPFMLTIKCLNSDTEKRVLVKINILNPGQSVH